MDQKEAAGKQPQHAARARSRIQHETCAPLVHFLTVVPSDRQP